MKITIELARPTWLRRPRSRAGLAFAMGMLLTLSTTAGVYALDRFSDVPSTHFAHNDINAIADAGITAGCGGSNYCPDAVVTRGQMAAFLHRSISRAGFTHVYTTPVPIGYDNAVAVASVSLKVPGATGSSNPTSGFVLVNATGSTVVNAGCSCAVRMRVSDPVSGAASHYMGVITPNVYYGLASMTAAYLFQVTALPGTTRQFNVDAYIADGLGTVHLYLEATALWVPFGSQGTSAP